MAVDPRHQTWKFDEDEPTAGNADMDDYRGTVGDLGHDRQHWSTDHGAGDVDWYRASRQIDGVGYKDGS